MAIVLTSGPGIEPVSLTEVKAHLRLDGTAEDTLLSSLILTSRLHVEAALGLALISQSWSLLLDRWPVDGAVPVSIRPLRAVTAIRVAANEGEVTELAEVAFRVDAAGQRIVLVSGAALPCPTVAANGIEIALSVGFGDMPDAVPAPIRHALLLLVAHWYEHRDPAEIGSPAARIPSAVSSLLEPYAVRRL